MAGRFGLMEILLYPHPFDLLAHADDVGAGVGQFKRERGTLHHTAAQHATLQI